MDISGKTFLGVTELTGTRLLACRSQHYSTLNDFPLSRERSVLSMSLKQNRDLSSSAGENKNFPPSLTGAKPNKQELGKDDISILQ